MSFRSIVIICLSAILLGGCVSDQDYKARLKLTEDNEGLRANAAKLNETIALKEGEIAALRQDIAALREERDGLVKKEEDLKSENMELKASLAGGDLELKKELLDVKERLLEKDRALDLSEKELSLLKARLDEISDLSKQAVEERDRAVAELQGTYDALVSEMRDEIEKGRIEVQNLRGKLTLSMVDRILFDSGRADIMRDGKKVLDRVAKVLKNVNKQIRIEGHTDNVPIGPKLESTFPTNWELSTARATNVLRYLHVATGLGDELFSAAGYAEFRPVATNETKDGRARNRRIEVVLLPLEPRPVVKITK